MNPCVLTISRCWCHPSSLLLASLMNKFTWVVTCVPPRTKNTEALYYSCTRWKCWKRQERKPAAKFTLVSEFGVGLSGRKEIPGFSWFHDQSSLKLFKWQDVSSEEFNMETKINLQYWLFYLSVRLCYYSKVLLEQVIHSCIKNRKSCLCWCHIYLFKKKRIKLCFQSHFDSLLQSTW